MTNLVRRGRCVADGILIPRKRRKVDYIYLLPAFLCFTAFLAGVIPCVWCLNADLFAFISVAIFVVSLLAHVYILMRWKRYTDSSPLAYAITQPVAHLIIMTFALCVGSVNVCQLAPVEGDVSWLAESTMLPHDAKLAEVVGQFDTAKDDHKPLR